MIPLPSTSSSPTLADIRTSWNLVKSQIASATPKVFCSKSGMEPYICAFNRLPADADVVAPGPYSDDHGADTKQTSQIFLKHPPIHTGDGAVIGIEQFH